MLRNIILYMLFLKRKAASLIRGGGIKYNGFSVIFAFRGSSIEIGRGTTLNSGFFSNLLGLYQRIIIVARDRGKITIGKNCGISGSTIYAMQSIEIGDETLIGANCKIVDNDFHPLDSEKRRANLPSDIKKRPVKIGSQCFIGMNSIILKGTELGDRCVVGAGSVVSGVFPPDCVIAGNPAKIIRRAGVPAKS